MSNYKNKKAPLVLLASLVFLMTLRLQANENLPIISQSNVVSGLNETQINGATKSTLIGSGAGALSGDSLIYYMNNQEHELRALTGENQALNGVKILRDGNKIHLFLPEKASFERNKANINADLASILNSVANVQKKYNSTVIHITGNADGTEKNQNEIALKRASNVVAYLQHKEISFGRLQASDNGARNPNGSNDTANGRKRNRRVDITLIPLTK